MFFLFDSLLSWASPFSNVYSVWLTRTCKCFELVASWMITTFRLRTPTWTHLSPRSTQQECMASIFSFHRSSLASFSFLQRSCPRLDPHIWLPWGTTHLANGPWNKSLNFIFLTKYVIPNLVPLIQHSCFLFCNCVFMIPHFYSWASVSCLLVLASAPSLIQTPRSNTIASYYSPFKIHLSEKVWWYPPMVLAHLELMSPWPQLKNSSFQRTRSRSPPAKRNKKNLAV